LNFGESKKPSQATFGSIDSTAYSGNLTAHAKNPNYLDGRWTLNMTKSQINYLFNIYGDDNGYAIVDSGNPYISLRANEFIAF